MDLSDEYFKKRRLMLYEAINLFKDNELTYGAAIDVCEYIIFVLTNEVNERTLDEDGEPESGVIDNSRLMDSKLDYEIEKPI